MFALQKECYEEYEIIYKSECFDDVFGINIVYVKFYLNGIVMKFMID